MKYSLTPLSVRLPLGADKILNSLVKNLHISKGEFIRSAILEKIEDALDIKLIKDTARKNKKLYSLEEVKRELDMED